MVSADVCQLLLADAPTEPQRPENTTECTLNAYRQIHGCGLFRGHNLHRSRLHTIDASHYSVHTYSLELWAGPNRAGVCAPGETRRAVESRIDADESDKTLFIHL